MDRVDRRHLDWGIKRLSDITGKKWFIARVQTHPTRYEVNHISSGKGGEGIPMCSGTLKECAAHVYGIEYAYRFLYWRPAEEGC